MSLWFPGHTDSTSESESVELIPSPKKIKKSKTKSKNKTKTTTKTKTNSKVSRLNVNNVLTLEDVEFEFPNRIMVLGPSESGKTNVIRLITKNYAPSFDFIFLFSPNEHEETHIPKKYRFDRVSFTKLKSIWNFAIKTKRKYNILVIMDDLSATNFGNKFFADFITRCRHDNISIIFGVQYLKTLPPVVRENIKQYIVCHGNNKTCDSLFELSSTRNKRTFMNYVSKSTIGKPVLLDFTPHGKELNVLEVPLCPRFKLKY